MEAESLDQKSSDNDSHNQRSEETSTELNLIGQNPDDEGGGLNSPVELNDKSVSVSNEDSCIPRLQEISSSSSSSSSSEVSEPDNQPEEQLKIETDSNPNTNWDNKGQSMESILADWNEDIEAFEMMEKDEL